MNRDYYNNGGDKFTSRGYIDPNIERSYANPFERVGKWAEDVPPNSHTVLDYLKKHPGEDISITRLRKNTGLSRGQVYPAIDSLTHYDPRVAIDPDKETETLYYLTDEEYPGTFGGL